MNRTWLFRIPQYFELKIIFLRFAHQLFTIGYLELPFVILVSSMLLIMVSCKCFFIYEEQTKCLTNLLWINVLITIQVPLFKGVQWIFIVYSSIVCSFWIIAELFIFGKCYDEFTFVFVEKVRNL